MGFEIEEKEVVGHVTCIKSEGRQHWTDHGQESDKERGGNSDPDTWLTLKCSCGAIFERWGSRMPKKEKLWLLLDCGCGIATQEPEKKFKPRGPMPMALRDRKLVQNFSLSVTALEKVNALSVQQQISLSMACERMIMAYEEENGQ